MASETESGVGQAESLPARGSSIAIAVAVPETMGQELVKMPKPKSKAFARIREEVIRLVALIPEGKFTTYGSIATHMNVVARHVAFVMSALTEEEAAALPWHRVVSADARISQAMPRKVALLQRRRLVAEGMKVNRQGQILDPDSHYHYPGPRRSIRWSNA